MALNLFDVSYPDPREHFLPSMIIGYLEHDGQHKNGEGFVRATAILEEMQNWGYVPQQTQSCLRKLTNKKLVETTERVTFEEDPFGELMGDLPSAFRVTTVGAYHLKKWAGTFAYLDAMAFDTPIFNAEFLQKMMGSMNSFHIADRIARTLVFRDYLTEVWNAANLSPAYFSWVDCVAYCEANFDRARQGMNRAREKSNRN